MKRFKKKAFTLIELIIVIVVLALLIGVAMYKFTDVARDAKKATLIRDIDTLEKVIPVYYIDHNTYPVFDGLVEIPEGNPVYEELEKHEEKVKNLRVVNVKQTRPYHTKLKHGNGPIEEGCFLYSFETGKVYYAEGVLLGWGEIVQIEAGDLHTVALFENGRVKAWGYNGFGQIGLEPKNMNDEKISKPYSVPELSHVKQISANVYNTAALLDDGTVKIWGDNQYGQLGDPELDVEYSAQPVTVPGLTNVKQIVVGPTCFAVMNDGTVKAWGFRNNIGNGYQDNQNQLTPITVEGLENVKEITYSGSRMAALLNDGTVKTWGNNGYGELGIGNKENMFVPIAVNGLENIKQVSPGSFHMTAVSNDGKIYVWGSNQYGQFGNGTNEDSEIPVLVPLADNTKAVASGTYHSAFLLEDGTLKTSGYNYFGQLGVELSEENRINTPVEVLTDVKLVATGSYHTVALLNDGTLLAWGNNASGQLGDGTLSHKTTPVPVEGLDSFYPPETPDDFDEDENEEMEEIIDIIIDDVDLKEDAENKVDGTEKTIEGKIPESETVEVKVNGEKVQVEYGPSEDGWKSFTADIVLDDTKTNTVEIKTSGDSKTFTLSVEVKSADWNIQAVEMGRNHTLLLMKDGTVQGLGYNQSGQLGTGELDGDYEALPVFTQGLSNVKQVVAGGGHSLAVLKDGTLMAWGSNDDGTIGDGTMFNDKPTPVEVLTGVKQAAAGHNHSLALKEDGTVWVWGDNCYYQIHKNAGMDDYYGYQIIPFKIPELSNVAQVFAGPYVNAALLPDGTVYTWGSNFSGELGYETEETWHGIPTKVPGLTNVKQMACGEEHMAALLNDGTVMTWGDNSYGQLGFGDTVSFRYTPKLVPGLSNVKQIAAGENYTLALLEDGTVKAWGLNDYGQVGIGSFDYYEVYEPTTIPELHNVTKITAGPESAAVLLEDGTVWTWGYNGGMHLGTMDQTPQNAPVLSVACDLNFDYHKYWMDKIEEAYREMFGDEWKEMFKEITGYDFDDLPPEFWDIYF